MPPKGKRKKGKQTTTGSSKRKAKSHQPDDEEDDILLAEVIPASPSAEVVSTKSVVEVCNNMYVDRANDSSVCARVHVCVSLCVSLCARGGGGVYVCTCV